MDEYQNLMGDVSYPQERSYAYLKLFSHAWNFGRFDLGVLGLEWICYLIFTSFITVKVAGLVKWDVAYISIPFYIAIGLGCLRSAFCGKRSRCAMGCRAFFTTFILLLYIFLILKMENYVKWSWDAVFIPLYVGGYWIWVCLNITHDPLFKGCMFTLWFLFPTSMIFVHFMAAKLSGWVTWNWWAVFSPMWSFQFILLIATPFFFVAFPDQPFLMDRVGPSFGVSIKPRYRVNLLFLTASVLNLPLFIFEVLLCLYLQSKAVPLTVAFAPLFIAEIIALILLLGLSAARKKRGTYCVRIDGGPGIPVRELW